MSHRCVKIGYASKREAKAALKEARSSAPWRHEIRVYRCDGSDGAENNYGCGLWHLSSRPHPVWDS